MAILTGPATLRRFLVVGDIPPGFRDTYRERLGEYAFRTPPVETGREEIEGWVQIHNLLDTDFTDLNRWYTDPYALFALRIDKKTLPAKLFSATLQKQVEAWCDERGMERCPPPEKTRIKEALEHEWLRRALPRVSVVETCWNIDQGYLVLHSLSDRVAERFRKRFHRTFGLQLVPWSPLDWVSEPDHVDSLLASAPSRLRGEGR